MGRLSHTAGLILSSPRIILHLSEEVPLKLPIEFHLDYS